MKKILFTILFMSFFYGQSLTIPSGVKIEMSGDIYNVNKTSDGTLSLHDEKRFQYQKDEVQIMLMMIFSWGAAD